MSSCPICLEGYSWDTSAPDRRGLPVQSAKCAHVFCYNCLLNMEITQREDQRLALRRPQVVRRNRSHEHQSSSSSGFSFFRRHRDSASVRTVSTTEQPPTPETAVQCPVCRTPGAFDVHHPIFSLVTCELLEERHKNRRGAARNNNNGRSSPSGDLSRNHTTTGPPTATATPSSPVGVYYGTATPASPSDGQVDSRGQPVMNAVVVQATPIVGDIPTDLVVATSIDGPISPAPYEQQPSPNVHGNGTSRPRLPSIFAAPTADSALQQQQQQQRYQPRHVIGRSHSPPQQRQYYNGAPSQHQQRHSYCPPSISSQLPHNQNNNNNFQAQQQQQQEQQRQRLLQTRHSLNPMGMQQQRRLNDSLSGSSFHGHDIQSHHRHSNHSNSGLRNSNNQGLPLPYGQDGSTNTIDFDRQRYYEMQQRQKNDMSIPSIFRPPA